jgi:hypothetical protein
MERTDLQHYTTGMTTLKNFMPNINPETARFHGETYDENLDKKRLTSQLSRIADVLGGGAVFTSTELCEKASVSFSSLRNRISDLRVYYAFNITVKRVKDGLWNYQCVGKMTPEEHATYLADLRKKKPIGNPELWGKMWQAIYIDAAGSDLVTQAQMAKAAHDWAASMSHKIYTESR